eukprot:766914-Hanusia_phi.AAC.2
MMLSTSASPSDAALLSKCETRSIIQLCPPRTTCFRCPVLTIRQPLLTAYSCSTHAHSTDPASHVASKTSCKAASVKQLPSTCAMLARSRCCELDTERARSTDGWHALAPKSSRSS